MELDWSVGQIMASLRDLDLLNNTLVYFTSDNGGHIEEKGIHGNREGGFNGIYRGEDVCLIVYQFFFTLLHHCS